MTNREHFEKWVRYVHPNMPLNYNEQEQYYYSSMVSMAWQAWQESPKRRPTEEGKVTKERVREMLVDPETIVDRLRGTYPHGVTYPANPLQKAAADEIERLREEIKNLEHDVTSLYASLQAEVNGGCVVATIEPHFNENGDLIINFK